MNMNEYQNYHEAKEHTSTDFPYNTYLCSIPLDFIQVPLHWHDEMELIVIKKGSGVVSVELHTEIVSAGDIVLILPGQLHSISQNAEEHMEYENILLKSSMLIFGEEDLCAVQYIRPLMAGQLYLEPFITPELTWYSDAARCIREIDRLCDLRPQGYQLAVKGFLFQFLFALVSNQKNKDFVPKTKTKSLQKMKTVLKFVEEHYPERISVQDMASLTFYSKSHFMKFFSQHMGMGFTEYLNDYRLTIASRLLASSDDTVLEIAAKTGFDNLSYFIRLFRRKFHITPGEYRSRCTPMP